MSKPKKSGHFLFRNIGKKIKLVTVICFWIFVALTILSFAFLLAGSLIQLLIDMGNMFFDPFEYIVTVGLGLIGSAVAVVLSWLLVWISLLPFYGFGELIDKAAGIEENTRGTSPVVAAAVAEAPMSATQAKTVSDRVEKLEQLRTQGLITEEEYLQALNNQ